MTLIVGRPKSRRRRWTFLLCLVAALGVGVFFIPGALAVHDTGAFELDGNATNGAAAGDDWDNVCHQVLGTDCSTSSNTSGATAVAWTAEVGTNASIFTGGGSKDPIDVSSWAWKDGSVPDKDNLLHSFAARYSLPPSATCPSGTASTCEVIYFGSDRFDNSGDAQQGFWFFQKKITLGNTPNGGGSSFVGLHTPGDLLVVSDFSNGGTTSIISAYKWDPTCTAANKPVPACADSNLRTLLSSTAANCASAGAADQACGLVNATNGTTAPWPFTDKSGNTSYLQGEFYEGGINLSTLGLAGECFSSALSETRSSTATSAVLKDFVLAQFNPCKPAMTTQASATVASPVLPGSPVHDTATITISGGANPPDPTGPVTFFLCGPIASGDCSTGGTNIGTGNLNGGANTTDGIASAQSPDVNTGGSPLATGRYCFRAEWSGDSNYGPFSPPISFTNDSDECFAVKDTSTTTTAQNWIPNDTATVTTGSGAAADGTVTFTLYDNGTCDGNVLATFANIAVDGTGHASTDNTTTVVVVTPGATVSWKATFTPTDPNAVTGSDSTCESSVVTITD